MELVNLEIYNVYGYNDYYANRVEGMKFVIFQTYRDKTVSNDSDSYRRHNTFT